MPAQAKVSDPLDFSSSRVPGALDGDRGSELEPAGLAEVDGAETAGVEGEDPTSEGRVSVTGQAIGLAANEDPALERETDGQPRLAVQMARSTHRMARGRGRSRRKAKKPRPIKLPTGSLTPQGTVAHITGEKLDIYISGTDAIKAYVAPTISAGRVAKGHVHFMNEKDFVTRFVAHARGMTNQDTRADFTLREAIKTALGINGFREGAEVYINGDRGTPSTAIHEVMHLYANEAYGGKLGFAINEGTAEWLCRLVIAAQSLGFVRDNYPDEHAAIVNLVKRVGEAPVMRAFFLGDVAGLGAAVDQKTAGGFKLWTGHMNENKFDAANKLMELGHRPQGARHGP